MERRRTPSICVTVLAAKPLLESGQAYLAYIFALLLPSLFVSSANLKSSSRPPTVSLWLSLKRKDAVSHARCPSPPPGEARMKSTSLRRRTTRIFGAAGGKMRSDASRPRVAHAGRSRTPFWPKLARNYPLPRSALALARRRLAGFAGWRVPCMTRSGDHQNDQGRRLEGAEAGVGAGKALAETFSHVTLEEKSRRGSEIPHLTPSSLFTRALPANQADVAILIILEHAPLRQKWRRRRRRFFANCKNRVEGKVPLAGEVLLRVREARNGTRAGEARLKI